MEALPEYRAMSEIVYSYCQPANQSHQLAALSKTKKLKREAEDLSELQDRLARLTRLGFVSTFPVALL